MAGTGWRVSVLQIKTLPAIKSRIHIALYIHLSINLSWLSCYLIAHLISGTVWFDRLLHISCNQTSQTFQGLLHSSIIVMGSITALSRPFTITTLAAFFAATADSVAKQGKPTRGESTDVMWSEESKGKWWMVKQIREVRYVQPRCWRIRAWQAKLPECLKMQKRSLKNMKRSHIYLLFGHMLSLEHD